MLYSFIERQGLEQGEGEVTKMLQPFVWRMVDMMDAC